MAGHSNGGWSNTGAFFGSCVTADIHANTTVRLDTWQVTDSDGCVIASGCSYEQALRISQTHPLSRMTKELA